MSLQPWTIPVVTVPPKGGADTSTPEARFAVQSAAVTWAWGSQPGEGAIVYVPGAAGGAPVVTPGEVIQLALYGKTFHGVVVSSQDRVASNGIAREVRFVDQRIYLDSDLVFGSWNNPQSRIVNGMWRRRYWHIRPYHFARNLRTWTDRRLTASEIIDECLAAPTVGYRWTVANNAALDIAVPSVDASTGRKLGDLLAQLSMLTGTVFTLADNMRLQFGVPGSGPDVLVPGNADDIATGYALTNGSTAAHVVGDRNVYQVLNLQMEEDWNRGWEKWWMPGGDLFYLTAMVYQTVKNPQTGVTYAQSPDSNDRWHTWSLAHARAHSITVREIAALFPTEDYRDSFTYAGRRRMDMPAALYLRNIVFRAFRLPVEIKIPWVNYLGAPVATWVTRDRSEFTIASDGPAQVEYDPVDGTMRAQLNSGLGAGPGLVLVRNANVGADFFAKMRPEALDVTRFAEASQLWGTVGFSVDDGGDEGSQVILLEEPAVSVVGAMTNVDGYAVFDASVVNLEVAPVRASLPLQGERFVARFGDGVRAEPIAVTGLHAEAVVDGSSRAEIPYADGLTAYQKAMEIAVPVLNRQSIIGSGSYTIRMREGDYIRPLSPAVSRVHAVWSDRGHEVAVTLAQETPRMTYIPEGDLDRAYRMGNLYPGQDDLIVQRRALEVQEMALEQNPELRASLLEAYNHTVGERGPQEMAWVEGGSGTLPVGTPLWKKPGELNGGVIQNRTAVSPSASSDAHSEFVGVTVRDNENTALPVSTQAAGVILARVKGPVAFGNVLGRANGEQALIRSGGGESVGTAMQAVPEGVVRLIRVRASGAGGGSDMDARWA